MIWQEEFTKLQRIPHHGINHDALLNFFLDNG